MSCLLSVYYTIRVKTLQGKEDICSVELGGLLFESAYLTDVKEQLSTWAVVHNKEQLFLSLEGAVHVHYEGIVNFLKNFSLSPSIFDLFLLSKLFLFKHLHCVETSISFLFNQ